jgi:hypothetical protein
MLGPQGNSGSAGGAARSKRSELFIVHCAVLFALVGLAISNQASSTLISDAVQAEFVASDTAAPAPMQLAQPAVETLTAREN